MPTSAHAVADFAACFTLDDLTAGQLQRIKLVCLDSLGVGVAASTLGSGAAETRDYGCRWLGRGTSPLWGYAETGSPLGAAFINGALSHALNFDAFAAGYAGLVVPAAIAAVDCSDGISGRELLEAIAVGMELLARIARAAAPSSHQRALDGQLQTTFGCALAAARVLRLPATGIHDALGFALMQAAGSVQIVLDGDPPAKAIYGGFPAQAGLQAALLAQAGLGATCDVFEGVAGLLPLHYQDGFEARELIQGLGSEFFLDAVRFKPWPVSAALFDLIAAAIRLREESAIENDTIESVQMHVHPEMRMWFEPAEIRRVPPNAAAAANSGFFAVAAAMLHGGVTLEDMTRPGLANPDVAQLIGRMRVDFDTPASRNMLDVSLKSKRRLRRPVQAGSEFGLTLSDAIAEKFRMCLGYAHDRRIRTRCEELVQGLLQLETFPNARALVRLIGGCEEGLLARPGNGR